LLDFVDGNVAWDTESDSTFGAFFDWYVGIVYHTGLPLCVGVSVYLSDAFVVLSVVPVWWLVAAVAWVVARLLRRLTTQKVSLLSDGSGGDGNSILQMLAGAITSFKAPTLFLFAVVGAVDVWMLLYAAYNLSATPVQLLLYVRLLSE
jgi:phosphatidylglycerophosphate synthase